MCLPKAYVDRDGRRELLMEEVTSLEIEGKQLLLKTLFGEQREIEANIKEINFLTHILVLESLRG
jgi:predicted RNA-binding protein